MAILISFPFICEAAKKESVAVMHIENSSGTEYGELAAEQLSAELEDILVNSQEYEVVERDKLSYCLNELGLQQTGIVDSSQAISLGRMAGARYSVFGKIISADIHRINNVIYTCLKGKVRMNIKFVDNETGVIKLSKIVEGSKSIGTIGKNKRAPEETLMHGAAVEAAAKIGNLLKVKRDVAA